jgi:hypothetical protein
MMIDQPIISTHRFTTPRHNGGSMFYPRNTEESLLLEDCLIAQTQDDANFYLNFCKTDDDALNYHASARINDLVVVHPHAEIEFIAENVFGLVTDIRYMGVRYHTLSNGSVAWEPVFRYTVGMMNGQDVLVSDDALLRVPSNPSKRD